MVKEMKSIPKVFADSGHKKPVDGSVYKSTGRKSHYLNFSTVADKPSVGRDSFFTSSGVTVAVMSASLQPLSRWQRFV
jgi:hypothetical protein